MPDEPRPMTPGQMRAEAASLESTAEAYLARAKQLRSVASAIEGLRESGPLSLTSDADSTILPSVNANSSAKLARGMSRSRTKKHPFVRALYEHPDPKKRMTVTDWAKRHGYKPGTVAAWVAKPGSDGARRVPRDAADLIEKELGLPADGSTWKNGITEPE